MADPADRLLDLAAQGWAVRYEHDAVLREAAAELRRLRQALMQIDALATDPSAKLVDALLIADAALYWKRHAGGAD